MGSLPQRVPLLWVPENPIERVENRPSKVLGESPPNACIASLQQKNIKVGCNKNIFNLLVIWVYQCNQQRLAGAKIMPRFCDYNRF